MSEVGLDIKDVIEEIGTSFINLRPNSGELGTEYLDYEMNRQVTKPFIREYFLEVIFPYDTAVIGGDVIQFVEDGRRFLVMNITTENLFDESVGREGVLYRSNVSGELQRASGEANWDSNYKRTTQWTTIKSPAYGLLTEKMFGTELEQDQEIGQIDVDAQVLYLPATYGARTLDRYMPASGEYYKIEVVRRREFDGVDVCHVAEDTRS
jgi:hypothetical protein